MATSAVRSGSYSSVCAMICISLIVSLSSEVDGLLDEKVAGAQQVSFTNQWFCCSEKPDVVINRVRSKGECILRCQGNANCSGANWKQPSNTCELYFSTQQAFGYVDGCNFFNRGKNSINKQNTFDLVVNNFIITANLTLPSLLCEYRRWKRWLDLKLSHNREWTDLGSSSYVSRKPKTA